MPRPCPRRRVLPATEIWIRYQSTLDAVYVHIVPWSEFPASYLPPRFGFVYDSPYQSTLDAVYVQIVPWSEFPASCLPPALRAL